MGISMVGVGLREPISQSGSVALTSRGPKVERNACCITRLRPQVASKVSNGRRYKYRTIECSMNQPNAPASTKLTTMATGKYQVTNQLPSKSPPWESKYVV